MPNPIPAARKRTRLLPIGSPRSSLAKVALAVGAIGSLVAVFAGTPAGWIAVPLSLGALVGLAVVPFPTADRLLAFALVLTLPVVPLASPPSVPLGVIVILVAGVRLVAEERVRLSRPVAIGLAVLWLPLIIGAAISNWPAPSLWVRPVTILLIGALASALGAMVWLDADRRRRWLDGLVGGLALVSISALIPFVLQFIVGWQGAFATLLESMTVLRSEAATSSFLTLNNWFASIGPATMRAVSPFLPAPNYLGAYLGVVLPFALVRWFTAESRSVRMVAAVASTLGIVTLLATYSRSSWLAAVAAVAVAGGLAIVGRRLSRQGRSPAAGGGALRGAALGLALASALGLVAIFGLNTAASLGRIESAVQLTDPSVTARIAMNTAASAALLRSPFRGVGLGDWGATIAEPGAATYIHNTFLEYGAAIGTLGLLWAIALVALPIVAGVAAYRSSPRYGLATGLGLVMIGTFAAVTFLFDDNLLSVQYTLILLWAVGGAISFWLARTPEALMATAGGWAESAAGGRLRRPAILALGVAAFVLIFRALGRVAPGATRRDTEPS